MAKVRLAAGVNCEQRGAALTVMRKGPGIVEGKNGGVWTVEGKHGGPGGRYSG